MKKISYILVFIICLLFVPMVQAKTINHFYADAGEDVSFEDKVNGSAALAGDNVEFNGNIHGVGFFAGNKVQYDGFSDYLVMAGNYINVSGTIANDTLIAGNIIDINKDAVFKRDAIILGSDITISGNINRNLTIYGGKVSISDSNISGNVRIYTGQLVVDDTVDIAGKLSYPEDAEVKISSKIDNVVKLEPVKRSDKEIILSTLFSNFMSFMSVLFVFAIMSLLIPKLFETINIEYETLDFNKGLATFTKGLLFLILVPFISLFLFVIQFGIPLALIVLCFYFIIIYLSNVFTGYLLGYKLWKKFFKNDMNILVVGILGYLLLFILNLIPGISSLVSLLTLLFGIGIICDVLSKMFKKLK